MSSVESGVMATPCITQNQKPQKGMSNCQTLGELTECFQSQLSAVKQMVQLRGYLEDNQCSSMVDSIDSRVGELETLLTLMKADLGQRKKALKRAEKLHSTVTENQQRLQHAEENLPERLPSRQAPTSQPSMDSLAIQASSTLCNSNKPNKAEEPVKRQKQSRAVYIPLLDYLTVDEYDSVPKYMKGRITYLQANAAIDEFNKALGKKYKLLATPKSGQNEPIKKDIRAFKQQETKDTKGCYFISEEDLKRLSSFKIDPSGRKLLTAFRHCGRIREIRGNGLTRLAVC